MKKVIGKLQHYRDIIRRKLGILMFDRNNTALEFKKPLNKVVVIRWDAKWGDSIVSSFIFREWRKIYPDIKIEVITTASMSDLFKTHFGVDRVYIIKKRPSYAELKKLAVEIGNVDLLVHLSKDLKMKDIYFMSRFQSDLIAGLDDKLDLINLKLGALSAGKHFSEKFKLLLEKTGVPTPDTSYIIPNNTEVQREVDSFIDEITGPILVLNPYGSGNSRKLSYTKIKDIIDVTFNIKSDISIIVLITPDKKSEVLSFCRNYKNVYCYLNTKSIYDSIAIMRHANWIISVDTATVHIAAALNKKLVAIYNQDKENFLEWGPNYKLAVSIFSEDVDPKNINLLNMGEFESIVNKTLN